MISLILSFCVLLVGYCVYGKVVERVFSPDDRQTPANLLNDGVDYVPMKTWKAFLVQLLNIAGTGPIFGPLMGACFGPVVFLWIILGSVLGGAVHDYMVGMISTRHEGQSIAELSGIYLGNGAKWGMRLFSVLLLVLTGTVFVNSPAALIANLTPEILNVNFWIVVILAYYVLATLLPIDKIIGKLYPVFGVTLIMMAAGILFGIVSGGYTIPEISLTNLHPEGLPVWPYMFVTVACGAISGFHATQSPMISKCITSEKEGRKVFYGAMICESVIALIWAAGGVAFYGVTGGLSEALSSMGQSGVVYDISTGMLGTVGGILAIIGVIACPITSGDTAFRSARLILSEMTGLNQKPIKNRLIITLPLLGIGAVLTKLDFNVLWRYFSWSNQTLAMISLWVATSYLLKTCKKKWASLVTALPAGFMTAVSVTYIMMAKEGFRLGSAISYPAGIAAAACLLTVYFVKAGKKGGEKLIGILLILAMTVCLSSCGGDTKKTDLADAKPICLKWWVYLSSNVPTALDEVLRKANEISAEKIGVTVEMEFKNEDQFVQAMNDEEYYDMAFTCDWCNDFDENARAGKFYNITELVKNETPRLYEAVDPWWEIGMLGSRVYGVPMLKDLAAEVFFRLNSDYFEGEKGLEIPETMKFEELESYLEMWKKDHPDEYPLHMTQGGLSGMFQCHERIVGSYLVIPYSKAGTKDGTRIIPIWEDEEYMSMLRCLHRWYELGYINPDATETTEVPYSLLTPVRTGTAWTGYMGWCNPDTAGFNVKLSRFIGPNMSRATQQGALMAINSEAPEENVKAALRYLELLYTDREFRDLLAYGIEGKHFEYYEGTVIRTQQGGDEYRLDNFVTGPATSATVVSASKEVLADKDQWKKVYKEYEHAKMSDTQGFVFNGTYTKAMTDALNAVWEENRSALETGTADPDETMAAMKKQMEEIGLTRLQEEAQKQMDSYLERLSKEN